MTPRSLKEPGADAPAGKGKESTSQRHRKRAEGDIMSSSRAAGPGSELENEERAMNALTQANLDVGVQSLSEPGADAAAAATVDPDPAVELAREYQAAIDRLNTPGEISDDDSGDFDINVVEPLEERLTHVRPASREGVIAILDAAAGEARRQSDEPPNSGEAMFIGVMQNARDALKAGVGLAALDQRYVSAANDLALMGLIADFHKAYAAWGLANAEWLAEKGRVDALPDCPGFKPGEPYSAFLKEHGVDALADRSHERIKRVKRAVEAVFTTEAHTHRGAVEKLKIVRLAIGDEEGGGDIDLESLQAGSDELWFAAVMRDFDRLARETGDETVGMPWGETRDGGPAHSLHEESAPFEPAKANSPGEVVDEPLAAVWAKWHALEWGPLPEGLTEEGERVAASRADQATDVAIEIVSAMPHTLIGAYAQIALLKNWAENAVPHRAKAALGRLYDRAEAALQAAAREEGGVS